MVDWQKELSVPNTFTPIGAHEAMSNLIDDAVEYIGIIVRGNDGKVVFVNSDMVTERLVFLLEKIKLDLVLDRTERPQVDG